MIKLKLNREIYSKERIDETIRVFDDYGTIRTKDTAREFFVEFKDCKYDENRTAKEFENYLIALEHS